MIPLREQYTKQLLLDGMIPVKETEEFEITYKDKKSRTQTTKKITDRIYDTSKFDEYAFSVIKLDMYLNRTDRGGGYYNVSILPICTSNDAAVNDTEDGKQRLYPTLKMFARSTEVDSLEKAKGCKITSYFKERLKRDGNDTALKYVCDFENHFKRELKRRMKNRRLPWFFTSVFKHKRGKSYFADQMALCGVIHNPEDDTFDVFLYINNMTLIVKTKAVEFAKVVKDKKGNPIKDKYTGKVKTTNEVAFSGTIHAVNYRNVMESFSFDELEDFSFEPLQTNEKSFQSEQDAIDLYFNDL